MWRRGRGSWRVVVVVHNASDWKGWILSILSKVHMRVNMCIKGVYVQE